MFRSLATQGQRMSTLSRASFSGRGSARAFSVSTESRCQPIKPINRRLEVDLHELTNLQYLEGVTLIDVRQPAEHANQQNIPGSLHIPLGSLRDAFSLSSEEWEYKYETPKPSKDDKRIIFYGRGNNASSAAVEIAHNMGYKKSRHYVGGMEDYCLRNNISLKKEPEASKDSDVEEHYNYLYYNPDLHYL